MKSMIKSFACALRGLFITFKSERNFRFHILAMCLVVALGLYLGLSLLEWGLIIFSIGFVLVSELFNTAVERLGDEAAQGRQNHLVRNSKDIAAAAVFLSAVTALVIGIIILFIPFVEKVLDLL